MRKKLRIPALTTIQKAAVEQLMSGNADAFNIIIERQRKLSDSFAERYYGTNSVYCYGMWKHHLTVLTVLQSYAIQFAPIIEKEKANATKVTGNG